MTETKPERKLVLRWAIASKVTSYKVLKDIEQEALKVLMFTTFGYVDHVIEDKIVTRK